MNTYYRMMLLGGMLATSMAVMADGDSWLRRGKTSGVAPVADARYARECGSCHYAYPPGLLPARSWQKLMGNLADHFGDNAELPPEDVAAITGFLTKNAADRSNYRRSARITDSISARETPLRITQVPYIAGKHDEIPVSLVTGNPKVRSLSNCTACHTRAETGSFSERDINIPGYGRWEDD
jgi:hypothetical protein